MLMGLMSEYIHKIQKEGWTASQFENELINLIKKYNQIRDSYLLIYASAVDKPVEEKIIVQDDYYIIHDLLKDKQHEKLDVYLETMGGSGEVAEEIVEFLHSKFKIISFVISGQAKSAGTIMALSGHEIFMTETGSLGPIDAQVKLGRSRFSAYDYMEWVNQKRQEAATAGKLNPFDAIMIAQITPGELTGVFHSLEYAKDLVIDWLPKYKFRNWQTTEDRGIKVTEEMKQKQAHGIASDLINHAMWRSHGRSIKIRDLKNLGLKINRIEDDPQLSDIVFRIQAVARMLFDMTGIFKIVATADEKIFKHFQRPGTASGPIPLPILQQSAAVMIDHKCPSCGKAHLLYAKLKKDPKVDKDMQAKGRIPFPPTQLITCICGTRIDLTPLKMDLEAKIGKKLII
jgi:hypothetical protein